MKIYSSSEKSLNRRHLVRNIHRQNEPRVLVADDDPLSAQALLQVLTNLGLNVTVVFRGLDAVEMLRNEAFDLFVLDWRMPDFDGGAVIKTLYQMAQKSDIRQEFVRMPLIVYTGLNERDLDLPQEINYFDFTDFLQKPSSVSEMAALVVNTLAHTRG